MYPLRCARSSPRRCTSAALCQPKVSLLALLATTVRTRFTGRRLLLPLRRWRRRLGLGAVFLARVRAGPLRAFLSAASRAAWIGSRTLAGGWGCGSAAGTGDDSVCQQATL